MSYRRPHRDSISRIKFVGASGVEFSNGTGNGIMPLISLSFDDQRMGLLINFESKKINCVNFSDRSKDFTINA